ncbi:MAG: type III-B CRISPR-associated protein Cas10/Cmr2 [Chromatiaceae bacterium]|nr:type III-B CRISPR-associated protein Cas10/Cmr2 [Chromatiaceae bacterium]
MGRYPRSSEPHATTRASPEHEMTGTDWTLKLAAWLHDPAEKALILMRTPEGHEFGTAQRLRERLGIDYGAFDKRADWLAAAADRPQWPRPEDERYSSWANVRFASQPVLIHPLSGQQIALHSLAADIGATEIKAVSVDHFERLIVGDDPRLTFLAFWRFGPEAGRWATELGSLWQMLPADTRTPDHSIWSHLDTVSALHTALADGDQPALLAMSFGPVQGFIAQARSTSDLWAGSHLLSSMVWEALKTIVAELGPDTVLFPALRGVPAVDAWLLEQSESFRALFEDIGPEFLRDKTDTNPLFAAALPNKFVCVVPSRRARELAKAAIAAARQRSAEIAGEAAKAVFAAAGADFTEETRAQIAAQMAEFPEASWAAATWPMAADLHDTAAAAGQLQEALAAVHPELSRREVFDERTWGVLTQALDLQGWQFWRPNAGVLYSAVYELAERSLAAVKAARLFAPLTQQGHRCTQCGEREWLTDQTTKLQAAKGKRKPKGKATGQHEVETVWAELGANPKRRAWAKEGEHLCALCTAKRLWPTLFAHEVGEVVGLEKGQKADRFVISTHALALATSIDSLLSNWTVQSSIKLAELSRDHDISQDDPVALPKALHARIRRTVDDNSAYVLKRLPSTLDRIRDSEDRSPMDKALATILGRGNKPETYYALIQMDGDRMGAWLAGSEDQYKLAYRDTWHPQVQAAVGNFAKDNRALRDYVDALRPPSPARHAAISRTQRLLHPPGPLHRRGLRQGQAALRRGRRCAGFGGGG